MTARRATVDPAILALSDDALVEAIVVFHEQPDAATLRALEARFAVVHPWWIIPAAGVVGTKAQLLALADDPSVRLLDARQGELLLRESAAQIGAPAARERFDVDGSGIVVAVLDTGIDDRHPDLDEGKVVKRVSFETYWSAGALAPTHDAVGLLAHDGLGHGTHVASTLAGTGDVAGLDHDDRYVGIAPGASLVSVQVSTTGGLNVGLSGEDLPNGGVRVSTWASIDAIEWVTRNADALGIRVVHNSWGSRGHAHCLDAPAAMAVVASMALEPELVWVFSAGNNGEQEVPEIVSPGCLAQVITVGAVDRQNVLASFSSRGPTMDGEPKPDVVAPGVDIFAAASLPSAGMALGAQTGTTRDVGQTPYYTPNSGTSMAAPHVSGLVALMLDAAPCLTPAQVKGILIATAKDLGPAGYDMGYGHGLVQSGAAIGAASAAC